jgi:AhpD family alkylhydroperoxidase
MTKEQIYKDIEKTLGLVPTMFKLIPEASLELEWQLFKRLQLEESPIPPKYKELIGVAVASAIRCPYCAFFHTETAKLNGATAAEIEDAVHYAKSSLGWSTYVNGMQIDLERFKTEIRKVSEYVKSQR